MRSLRAAALMTAVLAGSAVLGATHDADAAGNPAVKRIMIMMNAQASAGNAKGMQMAFVQVKAWSKPDEFPKWAEYAEKGRIAAHNGNLAGAKAVCTECHDAYRDKFREKYGSKSSGKDDKDKGGGDNLPKKLE